jgi:hypothetical protein
MDNEEDTEKLHPVVRLLVARMEAHPEEFGDYTHITSLYDDVFNAATEDEQAALKAGYRKIALGRYYNDLLKLIADDTAGKNTFEATRSVGSTTTIAPNQYYSVLQSTAIQNAQSAAAQGLLTTTYSNPAHTGTYAVSNGTTGATTIGGSLRKLFGGK